MHKTYIPISGYKYQMNGVKFNLTRFAIVCKFALY